MWRWFVPCPSLALSVIEIEQHDGQVLTLKKADADYDPTDRLAVRAFLQSHHAQGQIVTGLLYVDPPRTCTTTGGDQAPLNRLANAGATPGMAALERVNAG